MGDDLESNARLKWEIEALQNEVKELKASDQGLREELTTIKKDREKALIWGVIVLGGAVIGMATWFINLIGFGKPHP